MYLGLACFGRVWVRGLQVRGVARDRQGEAVGKIRRFAKFLTYRVLLVVIELEAGFQCRTCADTNVHTDEHMGRRQLSVTFD
jgi:hypothetical protein